MEASARRDMDGFEVSVKGGLAQRREASSACSKRLSEGPCQARAIAPIVTYLTGRFTRNLARQGDELKIVVVRAVSAFDHTPAMQPALRPGIGISAVKAARSEEHTSELQSPC